MSAQQGLSPAPPGTRPRHLRIRRDEVVRRGVRELRRIAPRIETTDLIAAPNLIQLEWFQKRMIRRGELPVPIRVGKRLLFDAADLDLWLQSQKLKAAASCTLTLVQDGRS